VLHLVFGFKLIILYGVRSYMEKRARRGLTEGDNEWIFSGWLLNIFLALLEVLGSVFS